MLKYVIGVAQVTLYKYPIVFPQEFTHAIVAAVLKAHRCSIYSAGFVYKRDGKWKIPMNKKSESLNIGPRKGDAQILSDMMNKGMTTLEIANMASFRRIQQGKKP